MCEPPRAVRARYPGRCHHPRVVQRLAEPDDASGIGPGWHDYLDRLGGVVTASTVPDQWDDYFPALQDSYALPGWAAASPSRRTWAAGPDRHAVHACCPGCGSHSHGVIVNLTTWTCVQARADFTFSGQHLQVMRGPEAVIRTSRRADDRAAVGADGAPPVRREAEDRVRCLRRSGPTAEAFTFRTAFPPPDRPLEQVRSDDDWFCPA